MGETDAARVTGRKLARIAAASRTAATDLCSAPDEGSLYSTRILAVEERRQRCGLLSLRLCWCSFTLF
jgi:hypothetical protein